MAARLRPFPFPINVGTDICQISRIYNILSSPRRIRFVNRVLAPEEVVRHDSRLKWPAASLKGDGDSERPRSDGQTDLWHTAAFVAGRFAAKEAAIKAHSHRRLTFHDVVIERRAEVGQRLGSGPPVARIKAAGGHGDDDSALVSISHDGDYATAVCVAHLDCAGEFARCRSRTRRKLPWGKKRGTYTRGIGMVARLRRRQESADVERRVDEG
ncbi:hypothetical protein ED733_006646 [Metarhizium rileyi]|uniref:4'-phosphopantetheinyl transferase domain-containing protein n=1 Tax=Metarhizium rileyi (strain RCEF 4871) TaxID=1649241 RepID=A0A5C6GEQ9_METRR|nr:hypothetical protein ED733_006646 [Metarhizium rileyi]